MPKLRLIVSVWKNDFRMIAPDKDADTVVRVYLNDYRGVRRTPERVAIAAAICKALKVRLPKELENHGK